MPGDEAIIEEIRGKLERDARVRHPGEIAISEQAGTVTLCGTVGSFQQRRAAVELAKSLARVRSVSDELSVDLWGEVRRQDESNAAFESVAGLHGVGGITNEIEVISARVDG